tara:strand:+ start:219 stop:524 length:306 start_codon:yes stop_codon:yes gene_type:complete
LAFGWLGYLPEQLDELTFREFNNAVQGLADRDRQHSRDSWEQTRMLASTLIQPHVKKGANVTPQKLWQFNWDPKPKAEKINKERAKYVLERNKARQAKNGK